MGAAITVQDWTTVLGATSSDFTLQSPEGWIDASEWANVLLYLEVADYSGGPSIYFQTSPAADEALWKTMVQVTPSQTGITRSIVRWESASTPLSSLMRWAVSASGSNWRLTFRVRAIFKNS